MGFMAGFGPAFANSYQQGLDRNARREEDLFDKQFALYSKNLDAKREYLKEDGRMADLAAQVAKFSGHGDNPYAASAAYDALKTGIDADYLIKEYSKPGVKFGAADSSAESKSKKSAMKDQMSSMGGGGEGPEDPRDSVVADKGGGGGGLFSKLFPGAKKFKDLGVKQELGVANDRVAQAAGVSPEEVQSTVDQSWMKPNGRFPKATFTPDLSVDKSKTLNDLQWQDALRLRDEALAQNKPEVAAMYDSVVKSYENKARQEAVINDPTKASNLYIVKGEDGQLKQVLGTENHGVLQGPDGVPLEGVIRAVDDAEREDSQKFAGMAEDAQKYRTSVTNTAALFKDGGDLIDMARKNPANLTAIGSLAEVAQGLGSEARDAAMVLDRISRGEAVDPTEVDNAMTAIEGALSKYGVDEIAANRSLFQAKLMTMTYRAGAMEGVRGQGASDKDITRIMSILNSSNGDPEAFANNMAEYLGSLKKDADSAKFVPYNKELEKFKQRYGYYVDDPVPGLDETLEGMDDPAVKEVLERIKNPPKDNKTGAEKDLDAEGAKQEKEAAGQESDPNDPNNTPTVTNQADYDLIPEGGQYRDVNGNIRVKQKKVETNGK